MGGCHSGTEREKTALEGVARQRGGSTEAQKGDERFWLLRKSNFGCTLFG